MSVAKTLRQAEEDLQAHQKWEDALWSGLEPAQHAYALACERMAGNNPEAVEDMLAAMVKMGSWAGKLIERRAQIRQTVELTMRLMEEEERAEDGEPGSQGCGDSFPGRERGGADAPGQSPLAADEAAPGRHPVA